jgi:hypothetical protein
MPPSTPPNASLASRFARSAPYCSARQRICAPTIDGCDSASSRPISNAAA